MDLLSFAHTYAVPLFAIGAAVVGAIAGGLIGRTNDRYQRIANLRREILLESLDLAYAFEDAMDTFMTYAPRGGSDPEADETAANAIERAGSLTSEMRRVRGRVSVVGSQGLIDAFHHFQHATDEYADEVDRQMNSDGVFRGAPANAYLERYAATLDVYINAIRRELRIRRKVDPRNQRIQ